MQSSGPPLRPKPPGGVMPARDTLQSLKSLPVRKNITMACRGCRAKKVKCDGRSPTCSNCENLRTECIYDNSDKRRTGAWKYLVDDLQRRNRKLESTISSLKCNSSAEAIERLQQLRDDQLPPSLDNDSIASESDPTASDGDHDLDPGKSQSPRESSQTYPSSLSEQSPNAQGSGYDTSILDVDWNTGISISVLPEQEVTSQATSYFFSCADPYFYVMPSENCENLIGIIYEQSTISTKSDLCLLCAIAAVGAKYCTDRIPDWICQRYFQFAQLLLQEAVEDDPLIAMRVCICLSVYLVLDKMTSARTMLATGLHVSRSSVYKWMQNASAANRFEWTRVFRTLAFTECWLASTLGGMSDLRPGEIDLLENLAESESASNPCGAINRRLIQSQIYKIARISAQVHARLYSKTLLSKHELGQLSAKFDAWLKELPESVSLNAVSTGNAVPYIRPILLMHMVNLSSRVTFYEHTMQLTLEQQANTSDQSIAQRVFLLPEDVSDTYASFAQQIARVVRLLKEGQTITKSCWITIHASFHAALGLLLRATQHLARVPFCNLGLEDLSSAYVCVETLESCSEGDMAAMRLLSRIAPLYRHLKRIADDLAITKQMTDTDADNRSAVVSQLTDIASQLMAGMTAHFQESWI